ncbi:hypothetical protein [Neptunomonas phycophila]|uniref:hypothetical protein n=1 Tax=Neptunomonas phycophila TaxID=1572645 RepID=UPI0037366C40
MVQRRVVGLARCNHHQRDRRCCRSLRAQLSQTGATGDVQQFNGLADPKLKQQPKLLFTYR